MKGWHGNDDNVSGTTGGIAVPSAKGGGLVNNAINGDLRRAVLCEHGIMRCGYGISDI